MRVLRSPTSTIADIKRARGPIVSVALLAWILIAIVIDFLHHVPAGEAYYLVLDLILLPFVLVYTFLCIGPPARNRWVQRRDWAFAMVFLLWAAILATYQGGRYIFYGDATGIGIAVMESLAGQLDGAVEYSSGGGTVLVCTVPRRPT